MPVGGGAVRLAERPFHVAAERRRIRTRFGLVATHPHLLYIRHRHGTFAGVRFRPVVHVEAEDDVFDRIANLGTAEPERYFLSRRKSHWQRHRSCPVLVAVQCDAPVAVLLKPQRRRRPACGFGRIERRRDAAKRSVRHDHARRRKPDPIFRIFLVRPLAWALRRPREQSAVSLPGRDDIPSLPVALAGASAASP